MDKYIVAKREERLVVKMTKIFLSVAGIASILLILIPSLAFAFPSITLNAPTDGQYKDAKSFYVNFTSNETINATLGTTSYVEWTNQSGNKVNFSLVTTQNWTNYRINLTPTTTDGTQTFGIYIVSNATGLTKQLNYTVIIDTTTPSLSVSAPTNSTISSVTGFLNLEYSASDTNRDSCYYTVESGSNIILTSCANVTNLEPTVTGSNSVIVYVNDSVGRSNSSTISLSYIRLGGSSVGGGGGGGVYIPPQPVQPVPVKQPIAVNIPSAPPASGGVIEAITNFFSGIANFFSQLFGGKPAFQTTQSAPQVQAPSLQCPKWLCQ